MRKYVITVALLASTLATYAKLELRKVFADNMVLQQTATITISGKAKPNATVKILTGWKATYKSKTDKDGLFTIDITTPKAGGPYNIKFDDGDILELKNVLIGEVWLAAGQSNMEMKVKGFDSKQTVLDREEIEKHASTQPAIRFLTLGSTPAQEPQKEISGNWEETNANTILEFSAIAYQFAAKLKAALNVPIGIVVAANSGTRIESWMSRNTLEAINDRYLTFDLPFQKNSPAAMYNTTISPLAGFKIQGVIWYQGEANRTAPATYLKQFPALVDNWRQDWKDQNLPFYTVEIAPFTYPTDGDKAYVTAFFRENQRKLSRSIKNVGIVSTVDIGSKTTVHPPDKTKAGNRLALLVLANTYLVKNSYDEAVYKSFKTEGSNAIIEFANCTTLALNGQQVNDIEIAGNDQVFYPANAKIENNKLVVWSAQVAEPKSVRYCFKAYSEGNLYNQANLPIPPFRTDNWSIIQKK